LCKAPAACNHLIIGKQTGMITFCVSEFITPKRKKINCGRIKNAAEGEKNVAEGFFNLRKAKK
jgi:hypothetical protein